MNRHDAAALSLLVLLAGCGTQRQPPQNMVAAASTDDPAPASATLTRSHPSGGPSPAATSAAPVPAVPSSRPAGPDPLQRGAEQIARTTPGKLPGTPEAAAKLLQLLPATIAGAGRTTTGPKGVSWGDGSTVTAAPLAEAAGPGKSMREFFNAFAASGQFTVTRRALPTSRLLWFVGTSNGPAAGPVAAFADADGQWLFGVEAPGTTAFNELINSITAQVG